MATIYDNLEFKTQLEGTWAAFFDLVGWKWAYNPAAVGDWKPDFRVTFPCGHSECFGSHTIYISVLAVTTLEALKGHPALSHEWAIKNYAGDKIADAGAIFGIGPSVTYWVMGHGAGGGEENAQEWIGNLNPQDVWKKAQSKVIHY